MFWKRKVKAEKAEVVGIPQPQIQLNVHEKTNNAPCPMCKKREWHALENDEAVHVMMTTGAFDLICRGMFGHKLKATDIITYSIMMGMVCGHCGFIATFDVEIAGESVYYTEDDDNE